MSSGGKVMKLLAAVSLLATSAATVACSAAGTVTAASARGTTDACQSLASCFSPSQIRVAYGIQPLTDHGIQGRGVTVVLPELAQQRLSPPAVSDIRQDLASFDTVFHLPAPQLQVTTHLAPAAVRWLASGEEMLDVEMIHAVAPAAAIHVILFGASAADTPARLIAAMTEAVQFGTAHGDVISMSVAGGEGCFTNTQVTRLHAALEAAARRHVTVVTASGDTGPVGESCAQPPPRFTPARGVSLPASDPLVLGVGGTRLIASHKTGAYIGETAWGLPYGAPGTTDQASSGGFSHLFTRPGYQDGIAGIGTARGVPDVSADASGHTGMALVISAGGGKIDISAAGGTSGSTPFWAGVIALADQYAGHNLGFVNPALYRIARSPLYHQAFRDITLGNNTVKFPPKTFTGYHAGPGWDPVTGLGSPNGQVLIPLLARYCATGI